MKTQKLIALLMLMMMAMVATAQNDISGKVLYHDKAEYPIEGVSVNMYNQNNVLLATTVTNNEGIFTFLNLPAGIYTFRAEANGLPVVNLYMDQAVRILHYLNGMEQFDEMQEMAADVDGSGLIDFDDFLFYVVNYFGYNAPFPAGEWRFTELEVNTESKTGGNGGGGSGSIGGSRIGDVETVFVPVGKDIQVEYVNSRGNGVFAAAGDILDIPVSVNQLSKDAAGFNFIMEFNPALTEILGLSNPLYEVNFVVEGNTVRASLLHPQLLPVQSSDGLLMNVQLRVLRDQSGDYLPFALQPGSHVVNTSGAIENQIGFSYPKISNKNAQQVLSVFPNPAKESFNAQVVTGQSGPHRLLIIAANGAIVMDEIRNLREGSNDLSLNINHLKSGVYQVLIHSSISKSGLMSARLTKY